MAQRVTLRPPAEAVRATNPYALPMGWQKRWDFEHDPATKKQPVPYKASKRTPKRRRHNTKRNVVRLGNKARAARRAARSTSRAIRNATNWAGAYYECRICRQPVRHRDADNHNLMHATLGHRPEPRTPLTDAEREEQRRRRDADRAQQPVPPRTPSPTKAAVLAQPSEPGSINQNNGVTETPGRPSQTLPPDASPTRRAWGPRIDGGNMAGRNGNGGGAGPAGAIVKANQAWAETEVPTVTALKDHLLAMDAAQGQVADAWKTFGSRLVAQRVHPAVAKPIEQAADELAALRTKFTEAFVAFEKIYADRLAHERNVNAAHKPDDSMFNEVPA